MMLRKASYGVAGFMAEIYYSYAHVVVRKRSSVGVAHTSIMGKNITSEPV